MSLTSSTGSTADRKTRELFRPETRSITIIIIARDDDENINYYRAKDKRRVYYSDQPATGT